jgi:ubiquitin-conjugating enzyme E2 Q
VLGSVTLICSGGSIFNEILTATGWNPAFCVEAIVRDIMTNMTEAIPPARLDPRSWDTPYTLHEAVEAYKRVAMQHGWAVPKGFDMVRERGIRS